MFGGTRAANALNFLKWKRDGQISLETSLLGNIHHEIELSDYQRAPSTGSESPSGLLHGESFNVDPIADLDLFFERLYNYYCEKGLWCIIVKWVVELLSLAFTICFSGFFLLYVDWNGLRNAKCGMDAVESGIKPCDLANEALHKHPLTPFTLSKAVIVGHLAIFSLYWIFCFVRFFAQLKDTLNVRRFYSNSLGLTDNEIQTIPWSVILDKVVQVQSSLQLCVVKDLSAHDVVMRLMRKENYLIGMLNKGVIAFPISQWVPGVGPEVKFGPDGTRYRLILTKTLEWTLNWCILQSMFDRNSHVRRDFVSSPKTLKKTLMIVGLVMLLLSPFLVIFMLVYLFLRHAEQFYNHPSTASSRRWSNLSKWLFREFNEVDHLFKHRINSSVMQASDYLKQFPSPILTIIAKFISFVFGGFAAILIIIAFLEESLLEGHIFGRNLLWYAAVFGAITAISRAAVTDDLLVLDPEGAMALIVQHTHHMPKRWRGKENTETVLTEFGTLFQYTGMMLLEEMASIFLTPYLLIFVVPKRVEDILQFISEFTVNVEGVGHVCSFSLFDFQNHGNSNYGSPCNVPRIQRSSQGKMEKSFWSFQSSYPVWEPNPEGKQFLLNIRNFRDQELRTTYSPGMHHPQLNRGYQFGSLRLIDADIKNYPYILDSYYKSRLHRTADSSRDLPPEPPGSFGQSSSRDFHMKPYSNPLEGRYEENWDSDLEDRSQSPLEASVSAPLFGNSILQQNESSDVTRPSTSHWWARSGSHGPVPQVSFLEPPSFNPNSLDTVHENLSIQSLEEEEHGQTLDWRGPQASFLEPPSFSPNSHNTVHEIVSNRSVEEDEQGQSLDWRRPQPSFIEPPSFIPNSLDTVHENVSNRSLEEEEQGQTLDWRAQASFLDPRCFHVNSLDTAHGKLSNLCREKEELGQTLDWRGPQVSFLEPWCLNPNSLDTVHETLSNRSLEEEEEGQLLDWRGSHELGGTSFVGDLVSGEFDLPFGEIYSRPNSPTFSDFENQ